MPAHKGQEQYENTFQIQPMAFEESTRQLDVRGATDTADDRMLRGLQEFANSQGSQRDRNPFAEAGGLSDSTMSSYQLAQAASVANDMVVRSEKPVIDIETADASGSNTLRSGNGVSPAAAQIDPRLSGVMAESNANGQREENGLIFHHVRPGAKPNMRHAPYLPDFSVYTDGAKVRGRGRFTDNRRREVQDVRKQGACIRCRMLKKPVSDLTHMSKPMLMPASAPVMTLALLVGALTKPAFGNSHASELA